MISALVKFQIDPQKVLRQFSERIRERILKKAIRYGCGFVRKDLKDTVPRKTGALKASISTKISSKKRGAIVFGVVGPRSKYEKIVDGKKHVPSKYAHFIETGRQAIRPTKKKALSIGEFVRQSAKAAPAQHPIQETWDARQSTYLDTITGVIRQETERELRK